MLRALIAVVIVCFAAASPAASTEPALLILGDSLSAGFGIAQEQSWPALLEQRLQSEGFPHRVINLSISGETTRGGLSRLPPALGKYQPSLVVIALGANDGLRGLPLEQMRENLQAMIQLSKASHARVLLVGMQLPTNYGIDYTGNFKRVYADLAHHHKVALVPFLFAGFAEQREAFQGDGLHPTAAVQPAMLANVWRGLQPLLKKRQSPPRPLPSGQR